MATSKAVRKKSPVRKRATTKKAPARKSPAKKKASPAAESNGKRVKGEVGLEWAEIPKQRRGGGSAATDWDPVIAELRSNPGASARIATWAGRGTASTTATKLRKRYPDVTFESRVLETGESALFAYCPK